MPPNIYCETFPRTVPLYGLVVCTLLCCCMVSEHETKPRNDEQVTRCVLVIQADEEGERHYSDRGIANQTRLALDRSELVF